MINIKKITIEVSINGEKRNFFFAAPSVYTCGRRQPLSPAPRGQCRNGGGQKPEPMKTQTRITLLLTAITLLFVAGFVMLRQHETRRERLLIRNKIFEKNTLFDRVLRLEESSLEMFAYDFSSRDETGAIVRGGAGSEKPSIAAFMPSFNVTGLWLCDHEGRMVYAEAPAELVAFERMLRQRTMFPRLFAMSYFCHFFVMTPQGLLEVRSAPVQPATDTERSSPPRGFLFAGRLWDSDYVQQLSIVTESRLAILPLPGIGDLKETYEEESGIISFYRVVDGWDRQPIAQIRVRSEAPVTREVQRTSRNQLILLVSFVSVVILLLSALLVLWVNLPLKRISASLHQRNPRLMGSLIHSTTEFGNLARLVLTFFTQQQELQQEIGVRKQAEEALRIALQRSERSGAETAALLKAARSVLTYHDFTEASRSILAICIELAGAGQGFIAQVSPGEGDARQLCCSASMLPEGGAQDASMPLDGLYLQAYDGRKPCYGNDMADPGKKGGAEPPAPLASLLCAPLIISGEVLAMLALANKPGGFADSDLRMAAAFSELAAVALLNCRSLESLETSEERFRSVVQTASDAIISVTEKEDIVFWNRAAETIFGYTPDEAIGKNSALLLPEPQRSRYVQQREQGLLPAVDAKPQEIIGLRKDGTQFHMEISRSSWRSRDGIFFTAIVRDISGRIELEQLMRLQEKMASLGRVTAGIAHEIRNPLTGINTYMYSLRKGIESGVGETQDRTALLAIAGEIQAASDKIEGVIRRVMDFAKPGMPRLADININRPLEEAVKLSAATLRKGGITLTQNLAGNLPACRADLQMIEQVMLNLITNAVQALEAAAGEKKLELRSWSTGGHILVTMADSGPGVSAAERSKIFDPFYTNKSDGSGIGLSLCQRIIADHRGTITVGASLWGGAEFRIELPAAGAQTKNPNSE